MSDEHAWQSQVQDAADTLCCALLSRHRPELDALARLVKWIVREAVK